MGSKIIRERIHEISYADDKILIAETLLQLQVMVKKLNTRIQKYGMRLNVEKIKTMKIEKGKHNNSLRIIIENKHLEQVEKYTYLGTIKSSDGRDDEQIRKSIGMARSAFRQKLDLVFKI